MKVRFFSEHDEWTTEGRKINILDRLQAIRTVLEEVGPIIVEHWFYRGSSAPDRLVFDDFDTFVEYLNGKAFAGDAIHIWSFGDVCKDDNTIANGKCPDDEGQVPLRGAY